MCLEVAGEANLGKEASPTVIGQRWEDAVLLVLVALALRVTFLLSLKGHALLCCIMIWPQGVCPRRVTPRTQGDLQAVFKSFSLPRDCALALAEFSVE